MATEFVQDLQSSENVNSVNPNLLIEDFHGTLNPIIESLHQSIDHIMTQVNEILSEGLNAETDTRIDQVIDGVDPIINDTVEQVNTVVDSHFQINPEGVVDPLTGETIIAPNPLLDATVITPINEPVFDEMIVSDPMAIDTSLIVGDLTMGTIHPLLDGTISIPTVMGTSEPLLDGTVNHPMITTIDPIISGTVSDSSLF
ncbi:hypothetical protein M595_5029 [Lyngbya aestuarii BL J]|uniref:Uncharacterized protein n=1 Tax=Lyngbya aestuarii BL J TaxID=1348334 RepID=U7QB03_9CYAN|nr:hypothetical protein [Lyngbya aestuarii]ERT04998.1 hypothetical protein M595_5029 [Lyngbya aestuarii BL J]